MFQWFALFQCLNISGRQCGHLAWISALAFFTVLVRWWRRGLPSMSKAGNCISFIRRFRLPSYHSSTSFYRRVHSGWYRKMISKGPLSASDEWHDSMDEPLTTTLLRRSVPITRAKRWKIRAQPEDPDFSISSKLHDCVETHWFYSSNRKWTKFLDYFSTNFLYFLLTYKICAIPEWW